VDFLGGTPFHFQADKRPHVIFVIGENEYDTWDTLPEFARQELIPRGLKCSFASASPKPGDNVFVNFEVIKEADLLFVSVRRRTPPKEMMALIRDHLNRGKPMAGIRTASHAFGAKPPDTQHEGWENFDSEVLGCKYQNHYANTATTRVRILPEAAHHPVLTGLPTNAITVTSSLYRSRDLGKAVTPLMAGQAEGHSGTEPIAWVNTANHRRVFYTSLGSRDDFKQTFFRRLLLNGILWTLEKPIPSATEAPLPKTSSP
jgi:type 1 glutamine amidotransferase